MSRIGKMPIEIPSGVDIKINPGNEVTVKGQKGTLTKNLHDEMIIKIDGNMIMVERPTDGKFHRSLHGLTRSLLNNMIEGVTKEFEKVLVINGVGYRAQKQGKKLVLTLGYSHPIEMEEVDGVTVEVPAPNRIIVRGCDKQVVGEFAAKVRSKRKPEVYKGKGIRYENEVVRLKEGKAGARG